MYAMSVASVRAGSGGVLLAAPCGGGAVVFRVVCGVYAWCVGLFGGTRTQGHRRYDGGHFMCAMPRPMFWCRQGHAL